MLIGNPKNEICIGHGRKPNIFNPECKVKPLKSINISIFKAYIFFAAFSFSNPKMSIVLFDGIIAVIFSRHHDVCFVDINTYASTLETFKKPITPRINEDTGCTPKSHDKKPTFSDGGGDNEAGEDDKILRTFGAIILGISFAASKYFYFVVTCLRKFHIIKYSSVSITVCNTKIY